MVITPMERTVVILRSAIACSGISVTLISFSVILSYAHEMWITGSMAALARTEMSPEAAICFFFMGIAAICGALLWRNAHGTDKHHDD